MRFQLFLPRDDPDEAGLAQGRLEALPALGELTSACICGILVALCSLIRMRD
jgi:hypothetical protein